MTKEVKQKEDNKDKKKRPKVTDDIKKSTMTEDVRKMYESTGGECQSSTRIIDGGRRLRSTAKDFRGPGGKLSVLKSGIKPRVTGSKTGEARKGRHKMRTGLNKRYKKSVVRFRSVILLNILLASSEGRLED